MTLPRCKHTGEVLNETSWPGWAKRRGTKVSRTYDRKRRLLADKARVRVGSRRVRPSDPLHPYHQEYLWGGYPTVYELLGRDIPKDTEVDERLAKVRLSHAEELDTLDDYHTGVSEGFVYIITNPAWPQMVKIGSAIDPESRLATFQTADPFRKFKLRAAFFSADRKRLETKLHDALSPYRRTGTEWFNIDPRVAPDLVGSFIRHVEDDK